MTEAEPEPTRAQPGVEVLGKTVHHLAGIERGFAMHLRAKAEFGIARRMDDARTRFAQGGQHFLRVVADGGHDPHACDHDASHMRYPLYGKPVCDRPASLQVRFVSGPYDWLSL